VTAVDFSCTWCGGAVEGDDGFRVHESPGDRHAVFCRLEHLVPWAIQGAHWEANRPAETPPAPPYACSWCEERLEAVHVLVVRHRGEHRITDAFCGVDHALAWAKAGGRWRQPVG
jgi:hypothetical protein